MRSNTNLVLCLMIITVLSFCCKGFSLKINSVNLPSKSAFLNPTKTFPYVSANLERYRKGISNSKLSAFSLDSAILPGNNAFFSPMSSALLILFSTYIAFYKRIYSSAGFFKNIGSLFGGRVGSMTKGILPGLTFIYRVLVAKIMMLVETSLKNIAGFANIDEEQELVGHDDWSICTLSERESVSSKYIKYRFEMENPSAVIPLVVGQELILCTVDSQNKVFKEPFFPLSATSAQGYFDVIVRRDRDSNSFEKFTKALDTLALGDEIAFKTGKNRLNYIGNDDELIHVTLIASGMGIIPAINILRGILPGPDSTIESVDLLWINEDKGDFFCNREVEKLEYRYFERLVVSRILESDLYGRDLSKVDEIMDQFTPYEPGKIAIVCGPDYVISKTRNLFYDMEYPTVNIMTIQS